MRVAAGWSVTIWSVLIILTTTMMTHYLSIYRFQFSSVHFSRSVVSDSLQPHDPQHARPPYPSPTPGVHPNPCLLCWWCHPTISSSVVPFSSCRQSFPALGSFQISQLSASGGQSIGLLASTSVRPMNTQARVLEWGAIAFSNSRIVIGKSVKFLEPH